MKVETHINGSLQLIVIPENDLERAIIAEFKNRKNVGKKILVDASEPRGGTSPADDRLSVSVEA